MVMDWDATQALIVARDAKELVADAKAGDRGLRIGLRGCDAAAAAKLLAQALTADPATAVETFGHINYKQQIERFSAWLVDEGVPDQAAASVGLLYETMVQSPVNGRPILPRVLAEIEERRQTYANAAKRRS
jgi:hypothetical protein